MTKYPSLILTLALLGASACNKKSDTAIAGRLFKFAQTSSNQDFCNSDSVSTSDCAGGDFYLTEKGNILYSFFCPGEDSISYLIGKFFVADSVVTKCTFFQKYSLAVTQNRIDTNGRFDADMNSGTLQRMEPVSIRLNKLRCEKFQYYFIANGGYRLKYVLSKPSKDYADDYLTKIGKVKSFKGL